METSRWATRRRGCRWLAAAGAVVLAAAAFGLGPVEPAASQSSGAAGTQTAGPQSAETVDFVNLFDLNTRPERLYAEVLDEWVAAGLKPVEGVLIEIPGGAFTSYEGESAPRVVSEFEGREGQIFLWEEEESVVTWEVEVPETGLYHIGLYYYPLPGKRAGALRALQVNGEWVFNELRRLSFERVWKDVSWPPVRDNQGNDIRPRQVEAPEWQFKYVEEADGMYREPFYIPLQAGRNELTFHAISEPIAVWKMVVRSPEKLPSYAEVLAEYRKKGYQPAEGAVIKFQVEHPEKKSEATIRAEYGFDPMSEPASEGNWVLNEFGSWRWREGGQWAEWKFTVDKPGLYKIGIKRWQGFNRLPSVREIRIDGKIPFEELREYVFLYDRYWQTTTLGTEEEPFLFYFDEGEHTLSMRIKVGRAAETIRLLERVTQELSAIARAIVYITGSDPDPYMEYEVHRRIPALLPTLASIRDRLLEEGKELTEYARTRVDLAELFRLVAAQINTMIEDPYRIHIRIDEFNEMQSRLGYYLLELRYQPMAVDYIIVSDPDYTFPPAKANLWQRTRYWLLGFLESFRKDYTGVGNIYEGDVLEVWVAWGREWATIIKEMIEEDFTPATGIRVNVNIVPRTAVTGEGNSVILLASASGDAPDMVIGASQQLPVEFAIRGGVLDLTQFEDFETVVPRFREGMLTPYTYNGGVYALPETQSFNMMFYRIDIMEEIARETGIMEPETWDEVLQILPSLQQRGMNFFYPSAAAANPQAGVDSFAPFLYQFGGDFYTEDGLRSALGTAEALQAFRFWTNLYANFKLPLEANFYNRMRTGEIPIGVADYFNYVLLSTAAPELTGWWRMVPIPGVLKEDGTIDRSAGGRSTASVIMADTERPHEAWELLKWWTSTEVQTRFAEELQALIGVEAKWNTANIEAFQNLPWPKADLEAVLKQWEWFKEKPVVLGDYFTARHIVNAWNAVVLEGKNYREALEDAIEEVNRELIRKQEEFGIEVPDELRRNLYRGRPTLTVP